MTEQGEQTPAAPAPEAPTQEVQPSPEAAPPQPEGAPPAQPEGGEGEAQTPDVAQELRALNERMAAALGPQEQAQQQSGDIFDDLFPQPEQPQGGEDPGAEYEYGPEYGPEGEGGQPDVEAQMDELVRERVAEIMAPTLQAMEADRRRDALGYLGEQYSDLQKPEVREAIRNRLRPLAEQYGNPHLLTDPRLVEDVLLAQRARELMKNEVSPEQAAEQGASLETGAGATAPGAEDPDAQFKRELLAGSGGGVID